jgi:hypothetical protein
VRIGAHGDTKRTGEPKVSQFQVVPVVNEEILRLEVPMEDPVGVTI